MRSIIRLLAIVCSVCTIFLPNGQAQSPPNNMQERTFSYITPENETDLKAIGSSEAGYYGPGIAIGEETGHLDAEIQKVRFYLTLPEGESATSYDPEVYIYDQASRLFVYHQAVKKIQTGWNEVVLNTPHKITSGARLVVGYMMHLPENAYILGVDTRSLAVEEGSYFYYHNMKNMRNTAAQGVGNNAIEVVLTESQEAHDAPQVYPFLGKFLGLKYHNESSPLHALVRNTGVATVNSLDISYTSEDKHSQLIHAEVTIQPGEYRWISVPVLLKREGKSTFSIASVNGIPNSAQKKLSTLRVKDLVPKATGIQRNVLAEMFVSEEYEGLPNYLNGVSEVLKEADKYGFKIHRVCYHLKDAYATPFANQWAKNIKLDTLAAMSVDRIPALGYQWMYISRGYYEMLGQLAKPSPFMLEGSVTKNPNDDEITVNVTVRAVGTLPEDKDIRLTLLMIQYHLPPLLPELKTLPAHDAVYRCHLTPTEGIPVKFTAETLEFQHTATFRSRSLWQGNRDNVSIIAFVCQNPNNKEVWERNVYHTIAIPMGNTLATPLIFKTPNSHTLYIDNGYIRSDQPHALSTGNCRIYDMQGVQLSEPLSRGTYIVILANADGEQETYKLIY